MSSIPFTGQRNQLSRDEAIEQYILLRLRAEDIKRLTFLIEGLFEGKIQLPNGSPLTRDDLKDTARTAFFGYFASLTDRDEKAVYAFDPLLVLFPDKRAPIIKVQLECEACHSALQQFRSNVAFHSRADFAAQMEARRALIEEDTFVDLEFARKDFQRLMAELICRELTAIPELPQVLEQFCVSHHPAFANVFPVRNA